MNLSATGGKSFLYGYRMWRKEVVVRFNRHTGDREGFGLGKSRENRADRVSAQTAGSKVQNTERYGRAMKHVILKESEQGSQILPLFA